MMGHRVQAIMYRPQIIKLLRVSFSHGASAASHLIEKKTLAVPVDGTPTGSG